MEFISRSDRQFRANLHSHTTLSDGRLTPEESVQAYKSRGYQILALTDHEAPYCHQQFSGPDFLLLTGYEAYIRGTKDYKPDRFGPEVHLNLFARDPDNLTFIGYDPRSCKYLSRDYAESLPKGEDLGPRRYDPDYIQAFIDSAVKNGYLQAGGDGEKLTIVKTLADAQAILKESLRQGDAVLFMNDLPDVY